METRMFRILEAVIDEYIYTGVPVGSAVIKTKLSFPVSPATIRSDMAKLEAGGWLDQPHTSAGRVPTIRGYRAYIDGMSSYNLRLGSDGGTAGDGIVYGLSEAERAAIDTKLSAVSDGGGGDSVIIESATEVLAEVTKCAIVSTRSTNRFSVISKVEVIPTGRRMYVLLIVTSEGEIKNRVCRLSFDLSNDDISYFTDFLNRSLSGIQLSVLSKSYVDDLAAALGSYIMTLSPLLNAVAEMSREMRTDEVVIKGAGNLIRTGALPAAELAQLLEQPNAFTELLGDAFSGIRIMLPNEDGGCITIEGGNATHHCDAHIGSGDSILHGGSLVAAPYRKGGKTAGSIGAIGPVRLDYKTIVPYMEYFASKITELLSYDDDD